MLMGEKIYLRLMEEKDISSKVRWINDPEVRKTLVLDYPISEVGTKQWLHSIASDKTRKDFIVCLSENDLSIGFGGFVNIDYKNRKAETYMTVGQKEYWGKGYAGDIKKTLLEYAFEEMGLNRVYSCVWAENEKMISLNHKFGFESEGVLREDVFVHGEYRDIIFMALLKRDYIDNKE